MRQKSRIDVRVACLRAAMTASTALRSSLETGDKALRSLMTQMEQVVSVHLAEPSHDKKKVEPIRTDGESTAAG